MASLPELTATNADVGSMNGGDDRIYDEAAALWRELYQDEPPSRADGATLLHMIMINLPTQAYERLTSPHMRPALVSYPKQDTR